MSDRDCDDHRDLRFGEDIARTVPVARMWKRPSGCLPANKVRPELHERRWPAKHRHITPWRQVFRFGGVRRIPLPERRHARRQVDARARVRASQIAAGSRASTTPALTKYGSSTLSGEESRADERSRGAADVAAQLQHAHRDARPLGRDDFSDEREHRRSEGSGADAEQDHACREDRRRARERNDDQARHEERQSGRAEGRVVAPPVPHATEERHADRLGDDEQPHEGARRASLAHVEHGQVAEAEQEDDGREDHARRGERRGEVRALRARARRRSARPRAAARRFIGRRTATRRSGTSE